MKPLLVLMRIIFVGIFWSIFFLEGIRSIMLINWRFDIIRPTHWQHAWNLWLSGWVIDDPKEWAFVLIILTFVPLWLTGWAALSMIKWGKIINSVLFFPLRIFNKIVEKPVEMIAKTASVKVVKKKKSYKEIRPRSIRAPLEDSAYALPAGGAKGPNRGPASTLSGSRSALSAPAATPAEPKQFEHSLFQFDDEPADFDFDLFDDKPKEEKPAPAPATPAAESSEATPAKNNNNRDNKRDNNNNNRDNKRDNNKNRNLNQPRNDQPAATPAAAPAARSSSNSTLDALKQKGYEVISGATIKNTLIDFIGVSDNQIYLCLSDKEPGDWLADEERFNDEEPLWFSESSHRISPVRKIDIARSILNDKLGEADLSFKVEAFVIEQIGNIINAEDMFDIWSELNVKVTRIDRGTPKELPLFMKAAEEAINKINKDKLEKVKKVIRSIS